MSRFSGKSAFVTGASSGVGREVVIALAREGARVCAVGRQQAEVERTITLAGDHGRESFAAVADVCDFEEVRAAVELARERFGGIDLLVHAAGIFKMAAVPLMSEADWDLVFDTNVKSVLLLSKAIIPLMQTQGHGAIVNVASVFGLAGSIGSGAYSASKAAVIALTRTMALDHIGQGIRINAVAPGSMATPMLTSFARTVAPNNPDALLLAAAKLHPIGRLIEPAEVASLILFLLSDAAGSIVGTVQTIDGGRLAKLGSA